MSIRCLLGKHDMRRQEKHLNLFLVCRHCNRTEWYGSYGGDNNDIAVTWPPQRTNPL